MEEVHDIELLIRSRVSILAIESNEEERVIDVLERIGSRLGRPVYAWSMTRGLRAVTGTAPSQQPRKPVEVLEYIRDYGFSCLFVLLDMHPFLKEPVVVRLLKDIAIAADASRRNTLVLLSHKIEMPPELAAHAGRVELPLPADKELEGMVYEVAAEWAHEHGRSHAEAHPEALNIIVKNLRGLTMADARRLARTAIYDDGALTLGDVPELMRSKYELLSGGGALSLVYDTVSFDLVAGLERLKQWVRNRQIAFKGGATEVPLDPPKGVLLLGVQGCGKSLAAKAIAGLLHVPLLRMDFGAVYDKYHGETERKLREALRTACVLHPCVLWMDEIEKGTSTGESDSGTSKRVLGTLLTWMAERRETVLVVATANNIHMLPPELIRKGRFDEIFFVDLPGAEARREIFRIHLNKRGIKLEGFDLEQLASASEGFAGAEIEQAVIAAAYAAGGRLSALSTGTIVRELEGTRPLSVVMKEQVDELRRWASGRTVPAD